MKKSTSVNCAVASVLPFSWLIRLMSLRDDDAVGAAREADLRRHDDVQLPAVGREHVDGGDGGGELAFVQDGPVLVFADRQLAP